VLLRVLGGLPFSVMNFLRFLMFLSLGVWLGCLIFLPIVAQISFTMLPSTHLAGIIVRNALIALHWIGLSGGGLFLLCSLIENQLTRGSLALLRPSHLIVLVMLALTAISQFSIIPRMDALRASAGEIDGLPLDSPIRKQFDALHSTSTQVEAAVLLLGIILLYLTSRRLTSNRL
jgi:Domain of unknown function (DUF4149)